MPHLAFALISVLAHVAAQEARITDLVKAEYTDEGCEAAGWGPFPNATVATSTSWTVADYWLTSRPPPSFVLDCRK